MPEVPRLVQMRIAPLMMRSTPSYRSQARGKNSRRTWIPPSSPRHRCKFDVEHAHCERQLNQSHYPPAVHIMATPEAAQSCRSSPSPPARLRAPLPIRRLCCRREHSRRTPVPLPAVGLSCGRPASRCHFAELQPRPLPYAVRRHLLLTSSPTARGLRGASLPVRVPSARRLNQASSARRRVSLSGLESCRVDGGERQRRDGEGFRRLGCTGMKRMTGAACDREGGEWTVVRFEYHRRSIVLAEVEHPEQGEHVVGASCSAYEETLVPNLIALAGVEGASTGQQTILGRSVLTCRADARVRIGF